jgi:hypothetical protein
MQGGVQGLWGKSRAGGQILAPLQRPKPNQVELVEYILGSSKLCSHKKSTR